MRKMILWNAADERIVTPPLRGRQQQCLIIITNAGNKKQVKNIMPQILQ